MARQGSVFCCSGNPAALQGNKKAPDDMCPLYRISGKESTYRHGLFSYFPAWEAASLIICIVTELNSTGESSALTSLKPTPSFPV